MLVIGEWRPCVESPLRPRQAVVDLTPWTYAIPCAVTLMSCVAGLYVVFSPIGFAGSGSSLFIPILLGLLIINGLLWVAWRPRSRARWGVQ